MFIMILMYLFAAVSVLYMIERHDHEYPYDLIVGFFGVAAFFILAVQWYTGWVDATNAGIMTITNYYMAGWTTIAFILSSLIWLIKIYNFFNNETKDVIA